MNKRMFEIIGQNRFTLKVFLEHQFLSNHYLSFVKFLIIKRILNWLFTFFVFHV